MHSKFSLPLFRSKAVIVLPARTDGMIWVGTLSWSASKPVEVRLLQNYNTSATPDEAHGKPVTLPLVTGKMQYH